MADLEFTALFPFCGLGAGARGFVDAEVRLFGRRVTFRALGGIDIDPVPLIIAEDGTWHRPMTTLELAALQGLPARVGEAPLDLEGQAVSRHRERIGNAVPVPTARAIAEQMLVALAEGAMDTWSLGSGEVWVEPPREEVARG